jgi:hypothetical protein
MIFTPTSSTIACGVLESERVLPQSRIHRGRCPVPTVQSGGTLKNVFVRRSSARSHDVAPFADERELAWRAAQQNATVTTHQPRTGARHERNRRAAVQELSVAGRGEASTRAIEAPESSA